MKWKDITNEHHGKWAVVYIRNPHPSMAHIGRARYGVVSHQMHRSPYPTLFIIGYGHIDFWAESYEVEFIERDEIPVKG